MRAVRVVVVVVALAAAACVQPVGPARTFDDYEDKARDTAETTLGSIQTVRLAVEESDGLIPPYASALLSDAEGDAGGAQATFEGIQPPGPAADRLREDLIPLLDEATDLLADARITARRAELGHLGDLANPLQRVAGRLEQFIEGHSIQEHGG
jgi:hypothetical protein